MCKKKKKVRKHKNYNSPASCALPRKRRVQLVKKFQRGRGETTHECNRLRTVTNAVRIKYATELTCVSGPIVRSGMTDRWSTKCAPRARASPLYTLELAPVLAQTGPLSYVRAHFLRQPDSQNQLHVRQWCIRLPVRADCAAFVK